MRLTRRLIAVAVGAIVPCTAAHAQTVYYGQNNAGTENAAVTTARTNFFSALSGGVGTESFESLATGTTSPIALTFPGAGTATLTGNGTVRSGNNSGAVAHSGSQYLLTITGSTGTEFRIDFSDPVAAFGFFGSDIGDSGSNLFLRLTRAGGGTVTKQVPYDAASPLANGNLLFYGLIDTANPFTSIEFLSDGAGDFFGFDDMTIASKGQVVHPPTTTPEPTTIVLLGAGLAGLGLASRRRAKLG